MKNATKLLPVSDFLKEYLLPVVNESRCVTAYCCVDPRYFGKASAEKENIIMTVGGGGQFIKEALRKRLDLFIELGNEFNQKYPEYNAKFYLIGHDKESVCYNYLLPLIKSANVELKPMTKTTDELDEYYRKASIYLQLSYWESFGIAQIEAMINRCIPIGNDGGAVHEVIANAGFIIKDYDKELYIKTIKDILDKKFENLREAAKQHVLNNFTLVKRKETLNQVLSSFNK